MTSRTRFILWWHRRVTHKPSLRWDPIVHDWRGRRLPTDSTLGWVAPITFWDSIFDVPKKVIHLYHSFLVWFAHTIPLDKMPQIG